jgi:hypothetical protein
MAQHLIVGRNITTDSDICMRLGLYPAESLRHATFIQQIHHHVGTVLQYSAQR